MEASLLVRSGGGEWEGMDACVLGQAAGRVGGNMAAVISISQPNKVI